MKYTTLLRSGIFFLCIAPVHVWSQSSLTLYGTLDAGMAYQAHSGNDSGTYGSASRFGLIYGGQSANRFGLKGTEKINSDTELRFVLESGFDFGNGTMSQGGRLFGRQAWLGLTRKGLGHIRLGRQTNFANEYASGLTPFGYGDFADATLGLSFGSANAERFSNMIRLETERFEGFKAGVGYSFSTQIASAYVIDGALPVVPGDSRNYNYVSQNNLRSLTTGVQYHKGPLYAMMTFDAYYPNAATAKGEVPSATTWIAGAEYDFDLFKISAAYGQTKNGWLNPAQLIQQFTDPSNLGRTNSSIVFDSNIAVTSYMLGLTLSPSRESTLFISFQLADPMTSMESSPAFLANTQRVYSVAYTYNLTPRTNIYAISGYASNYSLSQGLTNTIVGFGVRHKF